MRHLISLFSLPRDFSPPELLRRLERDFPVQLQERSQKKVTYLDTFDWRLMDAGFTLTSARQGKGVHLALSSDQGDRMETSSSRVPAFASDLAEGPFRDTLQRASKIRRLLPQVRATWTIQLWAVLNEDEKTVARILVQEGDARLDRARALERVESRLRLLPLKGYGAEYRRAARCLRDAGAVPEKRRNELSALLDDLNATPERHSSATPFPLRPGDRTDEACRMILRELLTTMQVNLDGVRRDLDSEFLHELRVAVRRARSVMTQVKGVFPEVAARRLVDELRWLGARTGPARDMDVYLLKVPSYQKALAPGVREELVPLVQFLEKKKRQAHGNLVRSLGSKRFGALVMAWSELSEGPVTDPAIPPPNAGRPIDALARERILKVFRKIIRKGEQIQPDTPAEALHRLRIDCKRLRYLITFFQSLFPPQALKPLIQELKRLQDNLGDFNDLQVQGEALHTFAEEMMETGVGPPSTLMAMGQLMGQLEAQQALERSAFQTRFQAFSRRKNRTRFQELFG